MSKLTDVPVYSAKTKKRVKRGILGSGLIVLVVMAILLSRPPVLDPLPGKIGVSMTAQVFREGELLDERVKDEDLILHNFLNVTRALLAWPNGETYVQELAIFGGQAVDFTFWNETSDWTVFDTGVDNEHATHKGQGVFGSGTTAPQRDNDAWEGYEQSDVWDTYSIASDYFTITIIVTASGPFEWTETCYFMTWVTEDYGEDTAAVLMFRDTFSALTVEEDDICVLNYRVSFSSGYTTNFMRVLGSLLCGAALDSDTTIALIDNVGSSRTVTVYTDDADADFIGHVGNVNHGGWNYVSTSSSGIPSRDAYRLLGSSVGSVVTTSVDTDNWDVEVSNVMIPSVAITVTAAGYFRYTEYSGGEGLFLMFALSHGSVYVADNTAVKATFTLEM